MLLDKGELRNHEDDADDKDDVAVDIVRDTILIDDEVDDVQKLHNRNFNSEDVESSVTKLKESNNNKVDEMNNNHYLDSAFVSKENDDKGHLLRDDGSTGEMTSEHFEGHIMELGDDNNQETEDEEDHEPDNGRDYTIDNSTKLETRQEKKIRRRYCSRDLLRRMLVAALICLIALFLVIGLLVINGDQDDLQCVAEDLGNHDDEVASLIINPQAMSQLNKIVQRNLDHYHVIDEDNIEQVHLIVLVGGYSGDNYFHSLGNILENEIFSKRMLLTKDQFIIHRSNANEEGETHDGIAAGGTRLAEEIHQIMKELESSASNSTTSSTNLQKVSLSFIGYSLGGLYPRYALPQILEQSKSFDFEVDFKVYVSLATPHLGQNGMTWAYIPRFVERIVTHSRVTGDQTARDLFRFDGVDDDSDSAGGVMYQLGMDEKFLYPLQLFSKRMAFAGVYGTDVMVTTETALFLANDDTKYQTVVGDVNSKTLATPSITSWPLLSAQQSRLALVVETIPEASNATSSSSSLSHVDSLKESARRLDNLGWTKVLVDFRCLLGGPLKKVPVATAIYSLFLPIPKEQRRPKSVYYGKVENHEWTSLELCRNYCWDTSAVYNPMYAHKWIKQGPQGTIFLQKLAFDMITVILSNDTGYDGVDKQL